MRKKKRQEIARSLFKKSLTKGSLDTKKVRKVITLLEKENPFNLKAILKTYRNLIVSALSYEEVVVETGMAPAGKKALEKKLLQKTGAKRVVFKENKNIIFGARIKHGDWVWDATLDSKLSQIIN